MRTRATLRPGQRGTKRWVAKYGDRLVCVRYCYDAQRRKRYTTVELIVAEGTWAPPPPPPDTIVAEGTLAPRPPAPDTIVALRVAWGEGKIRQIVKDAGGRWDAQQRVWCLRYDQAVALDLLDRIVE